MLEALSHAILFHQDVLFDNYTMPITDVAQLLKRRARRLRASLCPWETLNAVSYLGAKQSTCCGGPACQKTCKQNSFCVGVV